jgi:CubicO group peptidase (beta-lactamase class C family)
MATSRLLTTLLLLVTATQTAAQSPAATAPREHRGIQDKAELETFLDGTISSLMQDRHIAGGVVAVVKDGQVLLTKGYGFENVAQEKPVDPTTTLFRPGSVSKLFTWTAVMQLVEQGKLDLDQDVNRYLDFKIPATFPQPITLRHLMTHTLGVEEEARGLISPDSTSIRPMSEWLPAHMPKRIRPPGLLSSYSNWGTAVAGHIVELVAHQPFADYVQAHVLDPIGMQHSTPCQPLPAPLVPHMSVGYEWSEGRFVPHGFEYLPGAAPAGMMSATGLDMARFMLTYLNGGELDGQRIMAESTLTTMWKRQFGHDPRLPGFALGFYEKNSHGLRILGHGGDTQWFHTELALIPAEKVGLYASFNTNTSGWVTAKLLIQDFLDHYYPDPAKPVTAPADFATRAERFVGEYQSDRRAFKNYFKAFSLAGATRVSVADSGTTLLIDRGEEETMHVVEVGPLLFRNVVGPELIVFRQDAAGRVNLLVDEEPMLAYERQPWYATTRLHLTLLTAIAVLFVAIVIGAIGRLRRPRPAPSAAPSVVVGRRLLVGAAIANLIFVVAAVVMAGDPFGLIVGAGQGKVVAALAFPVLGLILTVLAAIAAVNQWRTGAGSRADRVRFSGLVVIFVVFAWSLSQWNLLGWRL